jgi:hypothetical protein
MVFPVPVVPVNKVKELGIKPPPINSSIPGTPVGTLSFFMFIICNSYYKKMTSKVAEIV